MAEDASTRETPAPRLTRWSLRLRGLLLPPLLLVGVALSWRAHLWPGPGGAGVDAALDVIGLLLWALGATLRLATTAASPVSEGDATDAHLAPSGPYAALRHPERLADALQVAGLLLIAHTPWLYALGGGGFLALTALAVAAEEHLLRARFGDAWSRRPTEASTVSARLRALATGPFAWRRALALEAGPFARRGFAVVAFFAWESFARESLYGARAQVLGCATVALLALWPLGLVLRRRARRPGPA